MQMPHDLTTSISLWRIVTLYCDSRIVYMMNFDDVAFWQGTVIFNEQTFDTNLGTLFIYHSEKFMYLAYGFVCIFQRNIPIELW